MSNYGQFTGTHMLHFTRRQYGQARLINDNGIQQEPTDWLAAMLSAAKLQIWWSNVGHGIVREDMKTRVYYLNDVKSNMFRLRNANTSELVISGYILLVNILCKNAACLDFFQSLSKAWSKWKCRENRYQMSLKWFVKTTDNLPLNWTIALRYQWYAGTSRETVCC